MSHQGEELIGTSFQGNLLAHYIYVHYIPKMMRSRLLFGMYS